MNLLHKFVLSLWILLVVSCTPVAPATSPTPTSVLSGTNTGTVSTEGSNELILATTTSTEDSGLLDFLLPQFEAQTGSVVKVVAVGTGEALTLGENGDADVLLVHARTREDEFIAANGTDVTDAFRLYLRPLLGSGMPDAYRLRLNKVARILKTRD